MGAYKRSFVSVLAATASLGFLVLPSTGAAQPCAGGTDVRNLELGHAFFNLPANFSGLFMYAEF